MSGISPRQKKDPKKRKRKKEKKRENGQGLKSKRGKTSFEKLHVSKWEKERGWDLQAVGWDSIKKERKEITFFL
jgi:hypothetical protein